MLTYIGFAKCGAIDWNTSILDGTFILFRLRRRLMQKYEMMRARTTQAPAMPPMAELLRPSLELEEETLSAPVGWLVEQESEVQLVLLEVRMEGV